ncbi:hypothetical protein AB0G76_25665 [Streptomyces asoensis]|uniref:hypothetical protein n=1 Tax=Streptomyces asoensis TaxID=249586 RepID=UPI003401597F
MNLRLLALGGAVAGAIALPLAMASAGPVGDEERAAGPTGPRPAAAPAASRAVEDVSDGRAPAGAAAGRTTVGTDPEAPRADGTRSPLLLGVGLATAARCGPELTTPDGVEAQTCVLSQGDETWGRTYYRNATGRALEAFLSLMGPEGRSVRTRCPVGAEDEPASCETPRERTLGEPAAYTAVTEFAGAAEDGPLLLRSGSN